MPATESTSTRSSTRANPRPNRRSRGLILGLALASLIGLAAPAVAQGGCEEQGKNVQCKEMGVIKMDSQRDIRGDPLDMGAEITLNTDYASQGARWFLFSVRNVTSDGSNPVTISLTRFATDNGDIVTTRVEHDKPYELNLWVDGLDLPVGQAIHLDLNVGCTDRGAFRLETLVMAFDRGYSPIIDSSGSEASLFSFTLLGVNKETGAISADGGGLAQGVKTPGLGLPVLGLGLIAVAAVVARRRNDDA